MPPTPSRRPSYPMQSLAGASAVAMAQPVHALGQLEGDPPTVPSPPSPPSTGKKWGMIIAIRDSASLEIPSDVMALRPGEAPVVAEKYPPLPGIHEDAEKLYDVLTTVHGYPPENIIRLMDDGKAGSIVPTHNNILREIRALGTRVRSEDRVCFFYAGHTAQTYNARGTEEDDMDEVLITRDGRMIIDNILNRYLVVPLPKDSFLVAILDSCHSGTLLDIEHTHCNANPGSNQEPKSTSATINRSALRRRTSEVTVVSPSRQMSLDKENIPVTHSIDPAHWEPLPRCGSPLSALSYPGCDGACRSRVQRGISVMGHKRPIATNVLCISSCEDSQLTSYSEGTQVSMARCIIDLVASSQDISVGEVADAVARALDKERAAVWERHQQRWDEFNSNGGARIRAQLEANAPKRSQTLPGNMPTDQYFEHLTAKESDPRTPARRQYRKLRTLADALREWVQCHAPFKHELGCRTSPESTGKPSPRPRPGAEFRGIASSRTHPVPKERRLFSKFVERAARLAELQPRPKRPSPPSNMVLSSKWPLNLQESLRTWFSGPKHSMAVACPHFCHPSEPHS